MTKEQLKEAVKAGVEQWAEDDDLHNYNQLTDIVVDKIVDQDMRQQVRRILNDKPC